MIFGKFRARFTSLLLTTTLVLGGCLADEKSEGEIVDVVSSVSNGAPVISGNPQSAIMIGDTYAFAPATSDPDGDGLSYSIENCPTWADFDTTSGSLSGQPTLGDVGVFTNITITVTDGGAYVSLPAFSIEVSQGALGSMTLSWTPPTQNTDGSALTNLAGYRIYYGQQEGNYPNRVDIETAGTATFVVENLIPNTYYVVATSVNSTGVESAYSNVAIKAVQ